MATTMANLEGTSNGSGNGFRNLQGNMNGKNCRGMATLVAKKTGKYVVGVKTRAANSMAKPRLRAKALGNTRGNERANLHCRQKQWQRMWQSS
jgi:hypothetical protein